jgi:hypothetical protein
VLVLVEEQECPAGSQAVRADSGASVPWEVAEAGARSELQQPCALLLGEGDGRAKRVACLVRTLEVDGEHPLSFEPVRLRFVETTVCIE